MIISTLISVSRQTDVNRARCREDAYTDDDKLEVLLRPELPQHPGAVLKGKEKSRRRCQH